MGLLDWIKQRNDAKRPADPDLDSRTHGHASWKAVFAEMRSDEASAKVRKETGREPECGNPKAKRNRKPSVER